MWDLNRAERRALAAALGLVGLGLVARSAFAPGPAAFAWQPAGAAGRELDGFGAEVREALEREARAQTPLARDERIDVNHAPAEELRRLPGVGPSLAAAIRRERERAPLASPADLERVPGIGEVTARRLAPHLSFGRASPADGGLPPASGGLARDPGGPATASAGARCGAADVDLNRAAASELQSLPGIGPTLATRIVDERRRRGPFRDVRDLTRVRGIGARSSARLEGLACVGKP